MVQTTPFLLEFKNNNNKKRFYIYIYIGVNKINFQMFLSICQQSSTALESQVISSQQVSVLRGFTLLRTHY